MTVYIKQLKFKVKNVKIFLLVIINDILDKILIDIIVRVKRKNKNAIPSFKNKNKSDDNIYTPHCRYKN